MNLHIDTLSGIEFEDYLLNLFKALGYEGKTTLTSNDYGADLVITKDKIKTVVQAKRYLDKVGISGVQEVIGAKGYYNADKCLVVTNNYFTPNAINLAEANNVELWDRDKLINMVMLSLNSNDFKKEINIDQNNTNSEKKLNTNQDIADSIEIVADTTFKTNDSILYERDNLLDSAIDLIGEYNEIPISLLQRKFKIGFVRASKLLNQLEQMNLIPAKDINNTYSSDKLEKEYDPAYNFNTPNIENGIHKNKHYFLKILLAIVLFVILSFIEILNINNALVGILTLIFILCFSYPISSKIIDILSKR